MKNDMHYPNVIKTNIFYLTEYTALTRVTHYQYSFKLNLWTATMINYFVDPDIPPHTSRFLKGSRLLLAMNRSGYLWNE